MTEGQDNRIPILPDFSQRLAGWERLSRPGRTIVMMGQGKLVQVSEANTEVFTFGAGGCTVVAIEGTRVGRRFGTIKQYLWFIDGLEKLQGDSENPA